MVWSVITSIFSFIWSLIVRWVEIVIAPITSPELLWIIIPIYLAWIFTEFFQEKLVTSLGNAISNGVVVLWVGIDWLRYIVNKLIEQAATFNWVVIVKIILSLATFGYGLLIIVEGVKAKKFIKFIGRIREVTYVLLMFSPIIYGVIDIDYKTILAIVLFFPVFYYIVEYIDTRTPNPKIYELGEA